MDCSENPPNPFFQSRDSYREKRKARPAFRGTRPKKIKK